jgi:Putative peptidoglycan binding domain
MPLRSARLTGDPVLNQCLDGAHRMFAGEDNLSVMRLQSALLDVGLSVGAAGADGVFGPDTGAAVTAFKNRHGLSPNDPVVGKGTSQALDDDLFRDPPEFDPAFAEFSPAVVEHRLEQFVARELITMLRAPFDSWRRMLATFALEALNSGKLLGVVAMSRAADLRDPFLAVADPVQANGVAAVDFFADAITPINAHAVTIDFTAGGEHRAFVLVNDEVILGRAVTFRRSDNTTAPETLLGVLVHELTHARNLDNSAAIRTIPDSDTDVYADTGLAAQRSATGVSTGETAGQYVEEITARHVHWVVLQELAGTPGGIAVRGLAADKLAAAALFYFVEETFLWDANQYGEGVNAQGDAVRFPQLDKWLRLCAAQSFSDRFDDDQQSTLAFQAAAQFCADQVANPTLDFAREDGLFPLISDFR